MRGRRLALLAAIALSARVAYAVAFMRHYLPRAVARDAPAIDALIAQYHANGPVREPPLLAGKDLDRLRDLTAVLGNRTPQLAGDLRSRADAALRAVRIASHEATVISLLSAGEYLA